MSYDCSCDRLLSPRSSPWSMPWPAQRCPGASATSSFAWAQMSFRHSYPPSRPQLHSGGPSLAIYPLRLAVPLSDRSSHYCQSISGTRAICGTNTPSAAPLHWSPCPICASFTFLIPSGLLCRWAGKTSKWTYSSRWSHPVGYQCLGEISSRSSLYMRYQTHPNLHTCLPLESLNLD